MFYNWYNRRKQVHWQHSYVGSVCMGKNWYWRQLQYIIIMVTIITWRILECSNCCTKPLTSSPYVTVGGPQGGRLHTHLTALPSATLLQVLLSTYVQCMYSTLGFWLNSGGFGQIVVVFWSHCGVFGQIVGAFVWMGMVFGQIVGFLVTLWGLWSNNGVFGGIVWVSVN